MNGYKDKIVRTVTYAGRTKGFTQDFDMLSDDEYERIVVDWYKKPSIDKVREEMLLLDDGGTKFSECTEYYYRDIMDDTVRVRGTWSINEVLSNKELLSSVVSRVRKNPKFFNCKSLTENIDMCFRVGTNGTAVKVGQFPIKIVDDILYEYNANGNYYDYSCGWGARLAGALKARINYFGTDPNYKLVPRLKAFADDYTALLRTNSTVDIRCQGSEEFVPEWEAKIGLAFSSPPYFLVEDYKTGNQSYKTGKTTYQQWLNDYLEPTIQNIYKYLIEDGYFLCNIKDFKKYTMETDVVRLAEKNGFELYKTETLKQIQRISGWNDIEEEKTMLDINEKIFVFIKKGATPKQCHPVQISLFDL